MAPPQWAYQVENFVTMPDEELICSICHSIFCDPVICPCDHVFCKVCISKWLQTNRNCPICRKRVRKFTIKQIVPIVKNLIMKLTLFCKNKEHGCQAQFTIEGCESHLKECPFEEVQCKNKPCKEKLLRKDISDHEANSCAHRYTKCEKCSSKMPLSLSAENHNCIKILKMRLKRKKNIIKMKNKKIEELKKELKTIKEAYGSSDSASPVSSTLSNLSPNEITINIAEIDGISSDSSDSSNSFEDRCIIGLNRTNNHAVSESLSTFMQNQDSEYQSNEILDSVEYQNEAQGDNLSVTSQDESHNDDNSQNHVANFEIDEQSSSRRPAKRRHSPLQFISDEDNSETESHSLPSPKRCWRLQLLENNETSDGSLNEANTSYMDAGPSTSHASTGTDPITSEHSNKNNSKSKSAKEGNSKKTKIGPCRSSAVFERTLALLEQYNLESDSDWFPEYASHQGDTTESDSSSSDLEFRDSSESSDSESLYDEPTNTCDLLRELNDSLSEEDPDWQPDN